MVVARVNPAMKAAVLMMCLVMVIAFAAAHSERALAGDEERAMEPGAEILTRFPTNAVRHDSISPNFAKLCGRGSPPQHQCPVFLPLARNATCCNGICFDVGGFDCLHCGSCTTKCTFGTQLCCSGKCVDFLTDPNNCGFCNNKCDGDPCDYGLCGYGD